MAVRCAKLLCDCSFPSSNTDSCKADKKGDSEGERMTKPMHVPIAALGGQTARSSIATSNAQSHSQVPSSSDSDSIPLNGKDDMCQSSFHRASERYVQVVRKSASLKASHLAAPVNPDQLRPGDLRKHGRENTKEANSCSNGQLVGMAKGTKPKVPFLSGWFGESEEPRAGPSAWTCVSLYSWQGRRCSLPNGKNGMRQTLPSDSICL